MDDVWILNRISSLERMHLSSKQFFAVCILGTHLCDHRYLGCHLEEVLDFVVEQLFSGSKVRYCLMGGEGKGCFFYVVKNTKGP